MNSSGFLILLTVVSIFVILVILVLGSSLISRVGQEQSIESQIDNVHIPVTLQSKQCNTGDGVDSGAQCRYVYSGDGSAVETALKNAAYTIQYGNQTEAGGDTSASFTGGNPSLSIRLNINNGVTTVDAARGN